MTCGEIDRYCIFFFFALICGNSFQLCILDKHMCKSMLAFFMSTMKIQYKTIKSCRNSSFGTLLCFYIFFFLCVKIFQLSAFTLPSLPPPHLPHQIHPIHLGAFRSGGFPLHQKTTWTQICSPYLKQADSVIHTDFVTWHSRIYFPLFSFSSFSPFYSLLLFFFLLCFLLFLPLKKNNF